MAASSRNPALDEARSVASDARNRFDSSIDDLTRRAEKAVTEGLDALRSRAGSYGDVAGERLDTAQRYVTAQVHERPLTATFAALGVGVVLGFLLSGGRR